MSSKGYEIKCRNDIIRIPDVLTGFKYIRSWGISSKGLKAKDEIIKVLLSYWDSKNQDQNKDLPSIYNDLDTNREKRQLLLQKYDEVLVFYDSLNEVLKKDINSVFKNFREELEHRKEELQSPDCYILVAGDRVAGKSSFINQVLGSDILPTQQLACTATVCEIRHSINGDTKKALLYKKGNIKPICLDLEEDEKQDFKTLKENIMELNHEDVTPYDKIEILWPFEILKEGIVFVDTPGIGENRMIVHRLHDYMAQSFGFIYIIDSAQASGLQKGRLQDFLRTVANSSDDSLDPRATMFVCNKWDVVPANERNDIRTLTMKKLNRIFPDVKDEQVFTISTLQALKSASYDSIHPEFKFLIDNGIKRLIPESMQNKVLSQYRWLSLVLQRICYSLKIARTLGAQWVKQNSEMIDHLKVQLDKLKNDADRVIESAKNIVEKQIDLLHKEIADFLRSRHVRENICTWKQNDCPKSGDYKKVIEEASEKISERIVQVIDLWENEHHFVSELQQSIIAKFEEECQLMEDQIQEVANVLRIDCPRQPSDFLSSISVTLRRSSKSERIRYNSISGLGSAVSCSGSLRISDKKTKDMFKKYKREKCPEEKMMQASVYFMESIFEGPHLRENLSKFLKRFNHGIDSVAEKIPDFIKADNELLWKTELDLNESRGTLKKLYPELLKRASELQGQLDLFYVTKCMKYDFSYKDITWTERDLLGIGSFADVYKAKLKVGSDEVDVALKITNDRNSVRVSTVTDILREENTLRCLKHENIIKFYGSVLHEADTGNKKRLSWIMILEYCYNTLKHKMIGSEFQNPGKVHKDMRKQQFNVIAEYVIQICSGLQYLHDRNLVHRDLKLENILLTQKDNKDIVKLTDVGLTKNEDFISGTLAGSPVYMAPEIILRNGIYDRKADVYSLAIILWEMWYGQDAADHIKDILRDKGTTLERALETDKLRPSLELEFSPFIEKVNLIETCWQNDPKKRLDTSDIKTFFQSYL